MAADEPISIGHSTMGIAILKADVKMPSVQTCQSLNCVTFYTLPYVFDNHYTSLCFGGHGLFFCLSLVLLVLLILRLNEM